MLIQSRGIGPPWEKHAMSDKDEANGRLHELDLYAWSKATELLLIDRQIQEIDWDAVGDELEKSAEVNDANPMREAAEKLLTHLTIWNVSPQFTVRLDARKSNRQGSKLTIPFPDRPRLRD